MRVNCFEKNGIKQCKITLPVLFVDALELSNKDEVKVRLDTSSKRIIVSKK